MLSVPLLFMYIQTTTKPPSLPPSDTMYKIHHGFASVVAGAGVRGFRCQPVEKSLPTSNRGSMCASVLIITLSSGIRSFGENSK